RRLGEELEPRGRASPRRLGQPVVAVALRLELVVHAHEAVGEVLPVMLDRLAPLGRERAAVVGVERELPLPPLPLELLVEREQQALLAAEVVVDERQVRAGLLRDAAGGEGPVAVPREDRERGIEDRLARRALRLLAGRADRFRHQGSSGGARSPPSNGRMKRAYKVGAERALVKRGQAPRVANFTEPRGRPYEPGSAQDRRRDALTDPETAAAR